MNCPTACAEDLVTMTLASCTPLTSPAGYRAFAIMKCDADFSDVSGGAITDVSTWEALLADEKIGFSGQILGSKAVGSDTTLKVASCLPEIVVGRSTTYTVQDYNADPENNTEYTFYKFIQDNYGVLKLFLITCDEKVFEIPNGQWSASCDEVRDADSNQPKYMSFTATSNVKSIIVPVNVPGIIDILP